ncbi:hypothetical protein J2X40_004508 [Sphingopyxis sp. BE249]|nr:hypothetical protein [Sphingopyxis sp. BE249]
MYLTIAEFVDPVHQKHPACLWWHGVDRLFIEPEKVVGFHIPFLLRRAGGIAFLLKGKEKRGVAPLPPGAVDQQVLRYPAKEAARIGEAVTLLAARRARENFLHEIRRFFGPSPSAKKMKEPRTMRPKSVIEVASVRRCHDGPVVGMRVTGRRHRKGVALLRQFLGRV